MDTHRYALYARVSGDRQEQEATIDSQIDALWARVKRDGLDATGVYADNPFTGTTLVRPALDKLVQDARQGLFDRVLIYSPDRLARGKSYLRHIITDQLASQGVEIVYLNYTVDDSPEGRLMDQIISDFAEYEREKILDRTRRGRQYRIKQGHIWRSQRPYGYRYVRQEGEKYGTLEVVPEEAETVRWIFSSILAGRSATWLADELTRRGIATTTGKARWYSSRVLHILHNPIYTGRAIDNRFEAVPPKNPQKYSRHKNTALKERSQVEWVTMAVPAMVTTDVQEQVCAQLKKNYVLADRNQKGQYLLAGLVKCGFEHHEQPGTTCGMALSGKTVKRWGVYRCSRRYSEQLARTGCKNRQPSGYLEELVWTHIVDALQDPAKLQSQIMEASAESIAQRQSAESVLEKATADLEAVQVKIDKLLDLFLTGDIDKAALTRRQEQLISSREAAQAALQEARRGLQGMQSSNLCWRTIEEFCRRYAEDLVSTNTPEHFEQRRRLLRLLVSRITVCPDKAVIEGTIPLVAGVIDLAAKPTLSVLQTDDQGHEFTNVSFSLQVPLFIASRSARTSAKMART